MIVSSRQSAVGSDLSVGIMAAPCSEFIGGRMHTEAGVILIALLWILTALSVIALSFSREGFVEVTAARNTQSLDDAYFIARAGIDETVYRLMQKRLIPAVKRPELEETPDPLDIGIATGAMGGGGYQVDIQDESGKVNLNIIQEEQLRALVAACGIPEGDAAVIVDSILDWRDADNLHRLNGAEDDYYQSLNPPYKAKNGKFDTVEELLLVRGVTPTYFYGYPERDSNGSIIYKYGLSRLFTIYTNRNQVNVNYAPLPVLLSIPGMSPQAAQAIYDRRHVKAFKSVAEINRDLAVNLGPTSGLSYLTTEQTGVYTLTASAHAEHSKAKRVIRAVISLQLSDRSPYQTLYWNENVPDYEGIKP